MASVSSASSSVIVSRDPARQRRECALRRTHLAHRNANIGAGKAIIRDRDGGWIAAFGDGVRRLPLELNRIRVAEPPQHVLKDFVPPLIEGQRLAERVLHRVRWIEMRAGHAPIGHRLGRGMRPLVLQELRQNMRVRPLRAPATRRRNRLEHLDPAHPAQEHAMRTRGEDMTHRRIVTVERRSAGAGAELCQKDGIGHTDAGIQLHGVETQVE